MRQRGEGRETGKKENDEEIETGPGAVFERG